MAVEDLIIFLTELSLKDFISIIIATAIVIRLFVYPKIKELDERINWNIKRLDEKLKIYKRLTKIEERLKI